MKGVILAGGNGTRLMPLTTVTNKCLLPIHDRPMIYHPIELMAQAGIDEILIVTGGTTCGDIIRVLKDGSQFGLRSLFFTVQVKAGGIAQALSLAEPFARGEKIFVVLGDNLVFGHHVGEAVRSFAAEETAGARVFLKSVPDPERFGIAEIEGLRILSMEEKPRIPKSNLAVTGFYLYDETVFEKIRQLRPSARGELEVTDLNRLYLAENRLGFEMLDGEWIDAGTFDSLREASRIASRYTGASSMTAAA